jgi:hypothetical protein
VRKNLICRVLAGLAIAIVLTVTASAAEQTFRAGAFAIDITPQQFPISVNGGMSDRQATSAHDPLHARCLVLDDGTTKIALAVCDSCMIPLEILDEAKQRASASTGIPTDRMLMSATHTHTAPTATGVFQSEPNENYRQFLAQRIADGIERAHANLAPAKIGWGVGHDPTQVFNRRWFMRPGIVNTDPFGGDSDVVRMNPGTADLDLPAGPVDPDVSILSVQSLDGTPIAVLANYSLHYVGGVPGDSLSADYFGEFANRFGQLIGARGSDPPFVGIMSNGTSGNINNINFADKNPRSREPFEQIAVVATSVAHAAREAYEQIEHHDWVSLDMRETELQLGVRLPPGDELAKAKQLLEAAGPGPYSDRSHIYARETVLLSAYPASVKARLQAIRIGGLAVVSTPCETFVETGLAIKERSPFETTFTVELANGYNGYLPTRAHHRLGGYETWRARSSYLNESAEAVIRNTLLAMLDELARANGSQTVTEDKGE